MISYNDLYESARKERNFEQLQILPKKFIEEVREYLKEKKELASKEDDVFSDVILKTKKQLENAVTLFKEIMRRRRKKILSLVLIAAETGISKQDFDNMLPVEKGLFEEIMKCVSISDKSLDGELNGKREEIQYNELVLFKDSVEEFVGMEGERMGPFEKGQVANIPKTIAKILIESEKAELVAE